MMYETEYNNNIVNTKPKENKPYKPKIKEIFKTKTKK